MWEIILAVFQKSTIIAAVIQSVTGAQQQVQTQPQNILSSLSSASSSPTTTTTSSSSGGQILGQNLETLIRPYVGYITFAIDVSAGIIIGISAIMALISFFKILKEPVEQQTQDKETIRLRLARGMLLALDFEVGSDILKTILVPSITELTILAVVVGIRIVLSWSLSKEINRHEDIKGTQRALKAFKITDKDKNNDLKDKDLAESLESYRDRSDQ